MTKIIETTMLEKKNAIVCDSYISEESYPACYALSFAKNLESLGFSPNMELLETLRKISPINLGNLLREILPTLKGMVGAHVVYEPMFKNFPESVMDAEEGELIWKQILGYISDSIQMYSGLNVREMIEFDGKKEDRAEATEKPKFKLLTVATVEDFDTLAKNTLASKSSVAPSDKEWLEWAICNRDVMPEAIVNKETLAFTANVVLQNNLSVTVPAKTCTDVLRLAVSMSNGDVSLAAKTRFKSFSRKERRFLWKMFESVFTSNSSAYEELQKRGSVYARLAERLHPSDFERIAPIATKKFRELEAGIKVKTFDSKLEEAFKNGNLESVLSLLKRRPGVFARRLDQTLRLATVSNNCERVINEFALVAKDVATPVLWSVLNFTATRENEKKVAFPKGSLCKAYAYPNKTTEIPEGVIDLVETTVREALFNIYSAKESMEGKKVFISEELKNFTVPSALRSTSRALRTVGRGSRINIAEDINCIRSFIYWKGNGVDLDLSAVMLNDEYQEVDHISYTNLKSSYNGTCVACHSGDIRSAPKGASEFIDVNLPELADDVKYIAFCVNSFSQIGFSKLEEAFFGIQERNSMNNTGEIFEPKTVKFKFDLAGDALVALPIVYDVTKRCFVWCDIETTGSFRFANNVEGNSTSISASVRGMIESSKTNLYDLFLTNCMARGATIISDKEYEVVEIIDDKEVHSKKKADIIFSYDEGITPFDSDVILSEYL